MAVKTGYISPVQCVAHKTGSQHPERPGRLDAINDHLRAEGLMDDLVILEARAASRDEIAAIHQGDHVDRIISLIGGGATALDSDTAVSPQSLDAAYLAAGSALTGVDALYDSHLYAAALSDSPHCETSLNGPLRRVFCGVRPPGHHAESARSMGFCIFNNAAVAAQYALSRKLAARVLILDWDVHHGNGTQELFFNSPHVFYYSLHQYPFYPGSGAASEVGVGEGKGFTLNRPLPAGTSEDIYFGLMAQDLEAIGASFKPDLVIISAGFDAHQDDPLGGMRLTGAGFQRLTLLVNALADQYAGGRVLSLLEGGYNLEALADSVSQHIQGLMD